MPTETLNINFAKTITVLGGKEKEELKEYQILSSYSEKSIDNSYLGLEVNIKQTAQREERRLPLSISIKMFCLGEMIHQGTVIFHNKPHRNI